MSNVVSLNDVKEKRKLDKDNFEYDLKIVKDVFIFKHFIQKMKPDQQRTLVVFILNISQGMRDKSVFIPPLIADVFYDDRPLTTQGVYLLYGYVSKIKSSHDKKLIETKIQVTLDNNNFC